MKKKIKWLGIISLGLLLIGVPAVYAGDEATDPEDVALEEIAANREAEIIDLAEYWSAQSEESVSRRSCPSASGICEFSFESTSCTTIGSVIIRD